MEVFSKMNLAVVAGGTLWKNSVGEVSFAHLLFADILIFCGAEHAYSSLESSSSSLGSCFGIDG